MVKNQWSEIIEVNEKPSSVAVDFSLDLAMPEPVSPTPTEMPTLGGRLGAESNSIRIQQIVVSGATSAQSGFTFETTLSRLSTQKFKFIPEPPIFVFFKPPKL